MTYCAPRWDRIFVCAIIPEDYLANVYHIVKNISELSSAPMLLANSIACTGADTCKLGLCLPKGALRAIASTLTESRLDLDQIPDFKLNLSGCPNTCGQHLVADLASCFHKKRSRAACLFLRFPCLSNSRLAASATK